MAKVQPLPHESSRSAHSRGSSHKIMPFPSTKSKASVLVDTWITNFKERGPASSAASNSVGPQGDHCLESGGMPDSIPAVQPRMQGASLAPSSEESPSGSNDAGGYTTLLHKYAVHPTTSRRLRGLVDLALMVVALIPTVVLRMVRAAMGFLGVTEHRWRGISMVVPLTPEDRKQLELTVVNLGAGRLGRRPEAPERGPVAPSQQLLLDLHAVLAAAASTATAFSLPYEGMPEAALHAKLASYLRSVAAADSVCTQDVFKAMRKIGRKTLISLCQAAPRQPTPTPHPTSSSSTSHHTSAAVRMVLSALHTSPSTTSFISRPKPSSVAKAFMTACLMQQSRSHPTTLIQLVTHLPDGSGDLVETMSLISLAPGAEYLRLLAAMGPAGGGGGAGAGGGDLGERFAEQLEAMSEFGRLRPSDAKKEAGVQGMAINARVHEVGIVRGDWLLQQQGAEKEADGVAGAVGEGLLPPIVTDRKGSGVNGNSSNGGCNGNASNVVHANGNGSFSSFNGYSGAAAAAAAAGGEQYMNGEGAMYGAVGSSSDADDDKEGLLQGANSTGPETLPSALTTTTTPPTEIHANPATPPHPTTTSSPSTLAPSPSSASLYPTSALDAFEPLYGCPRSGAFAVHGREPRGVGLSRLVASYAACHSLPLPAQRSLLRGLGYSHLEQLREEVELRKALCVAQALPVLVASLRLQCRSPACLSAASRTGSFAHVQQSLLSDLHRHERAYLEDTRGALEVLGERLVVRFVRGSEKVLPLHLSGSCITVSLPADCVCPAALAAAGLSREGFCGGTYGLTALLFNMGLNSLQSLGFLTWRGRGEPLQESINRHSLERLNEWAQRAGRGGAPALAALNRHCGPEGRRQPKDTQLIALVRRACSEVGAGRAVNCKSGKDRTALELAKAFAEEVVMAGETRTRTATANMNGTGTGKATSKGAGSSSSGGGSSGGAAGGGLLPRSALGWLEAQFLRGLSYVATSQNHGQPPAYAFNEMEILTLPPGWRPDWRLCGKVAS